MCSDLRSYKGSQIDVTGCKSIWRREWDSNPPLLAKGPIHSPHIYCAGKDSSRTALPAVLARRDLTCWTSLNYRGLKLSFVPARKKQSAHPERSDGMRFNPIKLNGVRGTEKQVKKGKTPGVRESYSRPTPLEHGPNSFWPAFKLV